MFGLSFWEIAIILAIALIVLGPSQLPSLAKTFGKSLREFRKATDEFRSTIQDEAFREEPQPKPVIPARTGDVQPISAQPIAAQPQPAPAPVKDTVAEVEPAKTEAPKTSV